jgi:putative transposase
MTVPCDPWLDGGIRQIRSSGSSRRATSSWRVAPSSEVCRHLEIAESTWHRWVAQLFSGMKADDAKRLKELERENARLKKLVANQALDIDMLKELAEGNF